MQQLFLKKMNSIWVARDRNRRAGCYGRLEITQPGDEKNDCVSVGHGLNLAKKQRSCCWPGRES